jgi:peroxiredoxin (alkyl hydroperoxide reductase subunit C)
LGGGRKEGGGIVISVGKEAPDFELDGYFPVEREVRTVRLHDLRGRWVVLCFYPADFTFVCPTELKDLSDEYPSFQELEAEVFGISTDTVWSHKVWLEQEPLVRNLPFALLSDRTGAVSREYGVYDEEKGISKRGLFLIDPDGILKAVYVTDDPVGRSTEEILRLLSAFRYVRENPGYVCPASWAKGKPTLKPGIEAAGRVAEQLKKE